MIAKDGKLFSYQPQLGSIIGVATQAKIISLHCMVIFDLELVPKTPKTALFYCISTVNCAVIVQSTLHTAQHLLWKLQFRHLPTNHSITSLFGLSWEAIKAGENSIWVTSKKLNTEQFSSLNLEITNQNLQHAIRWW